MAVVMHMRWAGVTKDQYEQTRSKVNWEGDTPNGAKYHVAAFDDSGARITDVWDSEDDFNNFVGSRLMPAVQEVGIQGEPQVEFLQVHAIYAPNPG